MKKAGILGGGQLGRMLLQAAANYPVKTFLMENDRACPAAHLCHHFTLGDIRNFEEVYLFGKNLDTLAIEIETVNLEALEKLEAEGVKVYPKPQALKIIRNKILQKQFYKYHQIPSIDFRTTENLDELHQQYDFLPGVHKLAMGGYDGRGVQLIINSADVSAGFDAPAVLEKLVNIQKEIAVIVAVGNSGETVMYDPVDMVFDQSLNQLNFQVCPAFLPEKLGWKVEAIAMKVVKELKSPGIFAVELFVDKEDNVFVNETAPRVHNSGHHTIEAAYSSQFDNLWRIMMDYPMGNPSLIMPAALVNLVGAENFSGEPVYEGLEAVLKMDNVFVHIYGKDQTRPGRKMGHVTILSNEKQELLHKANQVRNLLSVRSS
jgi:5-(carboxyamino)imidazole ribonucleotide synthase